VAEKADLRLTGADAVEMEAAAVAAKATEWNIPFYCVRVVTDTLTGLIWQGCVMGQSGDKCEKGKPTWARWSTALTLCESNDWRLPNIMELRSIVKNSVENPSIDTSAFPGTPVEFTWSSTTRSDRPTYAWGVTFDYGSVFYYGKSDGKDGYVRCVHDRE